MPRVSFSELNAELYRVLAARGFPHERATLVAQLFAENQRDGVYSHGLNRFAGFLDAIRTHGIDVTATPERVGGFGVLEQWDGRMGVGLWNATVAMGRAVQLAREQGVGCIGLRNTNHWMRGGTYALHAADAGCIGLCWTNTIPLMPPWGAADVKIGNNPLAIALPGTDGHVLLDMAMSQFSNGRLEVARQRGVSLPVAGGYDREGKLTRDPAEILASRRPLPVGHWKGSALAIVLDMLAAAISGGQASHEIARQAGERAVSQCFLALNVSALAAPDETHAVVQAIIDHLHTAAPISADDFVRYPGEGMMRVRRESLEMGVLVDAAQWDALRGMCQM